MGVPQALKGSRAPGSRAEGPCAKDNGQEEDHSSSIMSLRSEGGERDRPWRSPSRLKTKQWCFSFSATDTIRTSKVTPL